jgi:FMN-dependent NADH-azoreductase
MNLLHIDHSINGSKSISNILASYFIRLLSSEFSDLRIDYLDTLNSQTPALNISSLQRENNETQSNSLEVYNVRKLREKFAIQFRDANFIVFSTPIWNWNIPASLKAYIDFTILPHILNGKTETTSIKAKCVLIIISEGGGSDDTENKWETQYLEKMCAKLGATRIEVVRSQFRLQKENPISDLKRVKSEKEAFTSIEAIASSVIEK